MFTSYYNKYGHLPAAVCISARPPTWFKGTIYTPLAPTWDLILPYRAGTITESQYTTGYMKLLKSRGITPEQVLHDLPDDSILMCYETPEKFCHRHLVADWIFEHTGVVIHELPCNTKPMVVDSCFGF